MTTNIPDRHVNNKVFDARRALNCMLVEVTKLRDEEVFGNLGFDYDDQNPIAEEFDKHMGAAEYMIRKSINDCDIYIRAHGLVYQSNS